MFPTRKASCNHVSHNMMFGALGGEVVEEIEFIMFPHINIACGKDILQRRHFPGEPPSTEGASHRRCFPRKVLSTKGTSHERHFPRKALPTKGTSHERHFAETRKCLENILHGKYLKWKIPFVECGFHGTYLVGNTLCGRYLA